MTRRATRAEGSVTNSAHTVAAPADAEAIRQEIELRAYDRYCKRGCESGADVSDWLAAEQEVLALHAGAVVSRAT